MRNVSIKTGKNNGLITNKADDVVIGDEKYEISINKLK